MKIEYILTEEDFIEFHLFSLYENKNTLKTLNISKILLVGLFIYFSVNSYNSNLKEFAVILVILAILTLFFYTKIYRIKLRNHYTKIVRNNYSNRIGEIETLEFTPEFIITEDKTGDGKTKISEIDKINETQNNFFIKLSNGSSFIVSKNGIENIELIKKKWKELKIPISEYLTWKWD